MSKSRGLSVEVIGGELRISVGIEILKRAAENSPDERLCWFDEEKGYYVSHPITDPEQFTKDVMKAMEREEEDGSTPLHRFLDNMMVEAIEQGSLGVGEGLKKAEIQ